VAEEPFREALQWVWHVEGVEGFYSGYIAGDPMVRALARGQGPRISTDDRPLVEFGFARNVGRTGLLRLQSLRAIAQRLGAQRPQTTGAPIDWSRVEEWQHSRATLGTAPVNRSILADPAPELRHRLAAREAYGEGNLRAAGEAWKRQQAAPATFLDQLLVAEALADVGDPETEAYIEALAVERPIEAAALSARLSWRQGDAAGTAQHLLRLFQLCQEDAIFFGPLVRRSLVLAVPAAASAPEWGERLFAALGTPFAARFREGDRLVLRVDLSARLQDPAACVAAFAPFEPDPVWERSFLESRLRCYQRAGHALAGEAQAAVQDFLEASPPRFVVGVPLPAAGP
jgi:hypothetical protein